MYVPTLSVLTFHLFPLLTVSLLTQVFINSMCLLTAAVTAVVGGMVIHLEGFKVKPHLTYDLQESTHLWYFVVLNL